MNYETIPAQIRCTKCRTIQDASHKFCKECGINFIPNGITVRPSPFPQEGTKLDRDLEKWIEIEKRYFIPPVTCDQTMLCKSTVVELPFHADDIACLSTSPEASREMAKEFYETHIKTDPIAVYVDTAMKGITDETKQRTREFFTKCDCKSHIPDVFNQITFEDIIQKD